MSKWCPNDILMTSKWCANDVQLMSIWCPNDVLQMISERCPNDVQLMSNWCPNDVQMMSKWCPTERSIARSLAGSLDRSIFQSFHRSIAWTECRLKNSTPGWSRLRWCCRIESQYCNSFEMLNCGNIYALQNFRQTTTYTNLPPDYVLECFLYCSDIKHKLSRWNPQSNPKTVRWNRSLRDKSMEAFM